MQATLGRHAGEAHRGVVKDVIWDPSELINGHMLLLGDTGTGKTHTLRRLIREMQQSADTRLRVHLFDVHGENDVEGASSVQFSETAGYGFNPLEVNPDPHFGGVRRCVQDFIANLNRTSRKIGPKQEAVLRNLLLDLFAMRGFDAEDPSTWFSHEEAPPAPLNPDLTYLDVPFAEKDAAKIHGARWDTPTRTWTVERYEGPITQWPIKVWGKACPTLKDALRYAQARLRASFLGANQQAISNLEDVNRLASALHRRVVSLMKAGADVAQEKDEAVEKASEKAVAAYEKYVNSILTGAELEDLIKYDSIDVLRSVIDRLENLAATGIFKNVPPPFDPGASVLRYNIHALQEDEKKLFVDFRLGRLFAEAMQRGEQKRLLDLVVIDESKLFVSDDPEHILNKMIREVRKFGVGLILASQSPGHFPDDLIAGVATKIVLGLDQFHWSTAVRKLGLEQNLLEWIVPRKRMGVHMKRSGELSNKFTWVNLQ